ncbi:hypothetical protein FA95DRAFT_1613541 [Auriscalpium vulgare]|uniref:Uncharacterized protein n=1 Tax=Auriscalpium vulgare TaxID=40419 RepID=A0ACB8R2X9_9AGAM|nr:hypothetical protein FA95DRAFT_1613541 [Auriscalpium vulgare]
MHDSIDDSDSATAALNTLQDNDQIPVARPPTEVIIHIFTHLAIIDTPRCPSLGWLRVTHVCQRWRRVALEDPSLWEGNILCPFPFGDRWANLFFSRSQAVPLTIMKPPGSFSMTIAAPREIELFNNNITRIRVLHISTNDNNISMLCQSAPLLDTLDLTLHYNPGMSHSRPPTFPDGLLGGAAGAPALRHLRLETPGPLPWTSPLFERLISLEVVHRTSAESALADIMAALSRMPALENLVLSLFPRQADAAPIHPMALPQLRSLVLTTSIASGHHFLVRIALPATASVQCNLECETHPVTTDADLTALFRAAAECIDASAAPISRIRATSMGVDIWHSGDAFPFLGLDIPNYTRLRTGLVPSVLVALASEHLEELEVDTIRAYPGEAEWAAHLQVARALRHVKVGGCAVSMFCAALIRGPTSFLPALFELLILNCAHLPVWDGYIDGMYCSPEDALVRCLLRRAGAGNVLGVLEVAKCYMKEGCRDTVVKAAPPGFLPALTALELHDVHFSGDADWDELMLGLARRRADAGCSLKRLRGST